MNGMKKSAILALTMVMAVSFAVANVDAKEFQFKGIRAKNIIFMVPDGMGLADVTAARMSKNGPDGDRLSFEKLPVIGYQSTHAANSTVTDSAAAASAWASGAKYNNGEISCHGAEKLLGLFKSGGKTKEIFRVDPSVLYPDGEPTLAEMTETALDLLEKNNKGFFLMVEGSQIDWANHGNDISGQLAETLGFDEAVQVVLDWVNAHPKRRLQTLVVVVPDHETGGFAINGPYGRLSAQDEIIEDGWTTGGHSATDVLI